MVRRREGDGSEVVERTRAYEVSSRLYVSERAGFKCLLTGDEILVLSSSSSSSSTYTC